MYEFVDQRTYISIGENHLDHVESVDYPGHVPGRAAQDSWSLDWFKQVEQEREAAHLHRLHLITLEALIPKLISM